MKWKWRSLRRFIYVLLALSYFLGCGLMVSATSLSGNEIDQEFQETEPLEPEGPEGEPDEVEEGEVPIDVDVEVDLDALMEQLSDAHLELLEQMGLQSEQLSELYVLLESQQSQDDVVTSESLEEQEEGQSVSGNSISCNAVPMPFADYDAYDGTISNTWIDFFERICAKLDFSTHYVAFRSSRYHYVLAYGESLTYDAGRFSGTDLSIVTVDTDGTTTVDYGTESSFSLSTRDYIVYSDLGDFPVLDKGVNNLEFYALLMFAGFAVVYSVCHDLFDYVMSIYRK